MELQINTEKFLYTKRVYEGKLTADETLEMIVPDALPDVGNIIDTKADCYLKGKDSDNGSILINALVSGSVIFTPDDAATPKKVEFNIPVTLTAADEGIHTDSKIITSLYVRSAEAKLINPRKLSVRVSVYAEILCYDSMELSIPCNIEDETAKTQFLRKNFDVKTPCDVSEKLYVVSDEVRLSSGKPPIDEILFADVTIVPEDIKSVGSKVIYNGIVQTSIAYTSPDVSGVNTIHNETRFSQIIEMNSSCEGCDFNIISAITGVYMNSDLIASSSERTINLEVHIVSQCVAVTGGSFSALCDAYSPIYSLEVKSEQLKIKSYGEKLHVNDSTKVSIEAPGASEVITAYAIITGVTADNDDGNLQINATGAVHIIYFGDDGKICTVREPFKLCTHATIPYCETSFVSAIPLTSVSASIGQGSVEAKINITYSVETASTTEIPIILGISYDENTLIDSSAYPSIVIKRPNHNDTIWLLAKKYHSTTDAIMTLNKGESEADLIDRKFILIPKEK